LVLLGGSRVATDVENRDDLGDNFDRSVLLELSKIEIFMVEKKAKN
jgi:hypothetical protein